MDAAFYRDALPHRGCVAQFHNICHNERRRFPAIVEHRRTDIDPVMKPLELRSP